MEMTAIQWTIILGLILFIVKINIDLLIALPYMTKGEFAALLREHPKSFYWSAAAVAIDTTILFVLFFESISRIFS